MLKGIDISHHQAPSSVPWETLSSARAFVIVRHTYGAALDRQAEQHVRLAREHRLRVGAYHFFRASQPIQEQIDAFRSAILISGYGRYEDIVPAIDFEDDTASRPITPDQAPLCEQLCKAFANYFLAPPLLYITQRDWGRVGSPAWALKYPLWVAHYSSASRKEPATPNGHPWAIWQHRVGPLDLNGPPATTNRRRWIRTSRRTCRSSRARR
jgi:lysozyme